MLFRQLFLFSGLLLSGCGFQTDISNTTDDYSQRLANVIDRSPAELGNISPLALPPKHDIFVDAVDISLKDFYQLRHCNLYSLVAERNTALGKIQAPSQRYVYEIALQRALKACQSTTQEVELRQQLTRWQKLKKPVLMQQWQQLLQSREIRYTLGHNAGWLESQEKGNLAATRQALQYLLTLRPGQRHQDHAEHLERHLQQLQQTPLMAKMFRTQRLLHQHLSSLTLWLQAQNIKCPQGKAPEQVNYLRNVFGLFFVEQIQPLASRINNIYYQLMPLWQSLLEQHPPMTDWLNNRQGEFEQYRHSVGEHIRFWQALFKQCNLSPPAANQP